MPPFIAQKRRLTSPSLEAAILRNARKPNLFDTADKPSDTSTLSDNKAFLDHLNASDGEGALSDVSSGQFEDVFQTPNPKKQKRSHREEDEEEIEWEDAIGLAATKSATMAPAPAPSGDLELTLYQRGQAASLTYAHAKKKGPSKIERQIRTATHCMHVQFLLFHNWVRSAWACDKEVQRILLAQVSPNVKREVERWRVASGMQPDPDMQQPKTAHKRGREGPKAAQHDRNQRDWGRPAERQEKGVPNMSHGDPLLRLLQVLSAYWKKHFTITAPGLRKQGYKPLSVLEEEMGSWRNDGYNSEEHGELIEGIEDFRKHARLCEGSRDIGAQLFTALVRGLGLEGRLIASLQPVGFGWSKNEEAVAKKKRQTHMMQKNNVGDRASAGEIFDEEDAPVPTKTEAHSWRNSSIGRRRPGRGKSTPIDLVESSCNSDSAESSLNGDDSGSVVDMTPSMPRDKATKKYDQDMPAPTYWTEVISPITNEVHPVDPLVLTPAVATSPEHLANFEPRGAKADKAKQVFAYVIAYSPDGTAKEVTTRYLRRHMWPGRTKGFRIPIEKVPVYDHKGKIKRYEKYDWFKTVISGYRRNHLTRTAVDDLEELQDLRPVEVQKKEVKNGEETLQRYRNSAEFVLQRHLRREEALRPCAKPVKFFAIGKGEKAKKEPVYRRADIEICRTGESWHKEGRAVKPGEHPMKNVPVRAVTMARKREVEEAERDGGEKLMQGMYAHSQTDWIIPPPIKDGVIPKNVFGNMDCYVPSMVPKGAAHVPLRSTVRICKRLGIDYAEAVTGFEFGNRIAVPIISGVVVAKENEHAVIREWEKDEEERRIKEEGKREKAALAMWKKSLMGLRIIQRVDEEYGKDAEAHIREEMNPFSNQSKAKKPPRDESPGDGPQEPEGIAFDGDLGGGFVADNAAEFGRGGFLPEEGPEGEVTHHKGELTVEHDMPLTSYISQHPPSPTHTCQGVVQDHARVHAAIADNGIAFMLVGKGIKDHGTSTLKLEISETSTKSGINRRASPPLEKSVPSASKLPRSLSQKPARVAITRQPARRSSRAIKSHYFEYNSNEDYEESGGSDESFEAHEELREPSVRKKRGRPSGATGKKRSMTSM
ncbi:MAG: hypothetical protein Q9163_000134 [Psora crenata]